jgi:Spy/CpxP family protein refolding chaperone
MYILERNVFSRTTMLIGQLIGGYQNNMKNRTLLISLLVIACLACGIGIQAIAQGPGGGGGGFGGMGGGGGMGGMGGGMGGFQMPAGSITQEQRTKLSEAVPADKTTALNDAQKAAVVAAIAKDATEASVKAKIDAVAKIQTEIAILKFKQIKALALTEEQITALKDNPQAYNTLFGSGGGRGFGGGMPGGMPGMGGPGGGMGGPGGGMGGPGGGMRGPGGN